MSYILDALKKKGAANSDEETVPDLKSQHYHSEIEDYNSNSRKFILIILAVLSVLLVIYLAYLFGKDQKPNLVQQEPSQRVISESQVTTSFEEKNNEVIDLQVETKPIELKEAVVKKVAQHKVVQSSNGQIKKTTRQSKKNTAKKEAITVSTGVLDKNLSALPAIRYTSHIYADNAKDRFVMLNGRALGIEQKLPNGVKIIDILENDLIISYQGKQYKIPSLTDVNQ